MAEIVSSISQLKSAFKIHSKCAGDDAKEISHKLLLFYAAECGLKHNFLRANKGLDTSDLTALCGKKYGHGHDLMEWIKVLKIPNLGFKDDQTPPLVQMHERLRYGTFTQSQSDLNQVKFLKDLLALLKKNF